MATFVCDAGPALNEALNGGVHKVPTISAENRLSLKNGRRRKISSSVS